MTAAGDPIAYYISFAFPPPKSGEPDTGTASVEIAETYHEHAGYGLWPRRVVAGASSRPRVVAPHP